MALTGALKEDTQHKMDRLGAREPELVPLTAGPGSKRQLMQDTAGVRRREEKGKREGESDGAMVQRRDAGREEE